MKTVVLTGPKSMKVVEAEKPKSKNGHVIVKVLATAICGADLHYWATGEQTENGTAVVRGHELVGIVDDPGSRTDLHVGDKVWVAPGDPCGECVYCKEGAVNLCDGARRGIGIVPEMPGSFAEYLSTRPDHVIALPDGITDLEAAVLEPCIVAYHCYGKMNPDVNKPLLIIGAGPIGVLTAMWAKNGGVKKVVMTDTNDNRLVLAKNLGIVDETYNALSENHVEDLKKASGDVGFTQCIDCVGFSSSINSAFKSMRALGTIVVVGYPRHPLSIDIQGLIDAELNLVGSYGYTLEDAYPVVDAIISKKINAEGIITKQTTLDQLPQAFESLGSKENPDLKVVIFP
ncbi:MAG: zinc-binding dehydrogenase [Candidatus Fimivivens sp.]